MSNIQKYLARPLSVEPFLKSIFHKNAALVIFDIGACEGEESIRYSRLFPDATVYAFEPLAENFRKATENFTKYSHGNISIFPFALGNKKGVSRFHVSSGSPQGKENNEEWNYGNKSSSLLEPGEVSKVFNWLNFSEERAVEVQRLDDFMHDKNIPAVDFIHMDVQGAELAVLEGAGNLLKNVKSIWLEVENRPLYKDQPLRRDMEKFLISRGFRLVFQEVDRIGGDQFYINSAKIHLPEKLPLQNSEIRRSFVERAKRKVRTILNGESQLYIKHSFAQCGEDLIVDYIFRTIGITMPSYIDIGAHHPFYLNNTALFYQRGSRGINIEPDPDLYKTIAHHRSGDTNLNIGIGAREATLQFYKMDVSTLNTFSKEEAEKMSHAEGHKILEEIPVPVLPVDTIINQYCKGHFPEFLSLDVEGYEMEILQSIRFGSSDPIVICMETISYATDGGGTKNQSLISYLLSRGYLHYADTYINSIFVKKDYWQFNG
jgi:FkbM family methyltransferase